LTALLIAAAVWVIEKHTQLREAHPHLDYLTGWILFGLTLFLTAYNLRKKLSFLPLLSSRTWFQAHVYLGLFTGLMFLLHLRWRWPTGRFEVLLALIFASVTLSGMVGWWLSRTLPRRLTTAGGEVPYERIPIVRRALREEAERLVLGIIPAAKATTLADFYAGRLAGYFAAPANFGPHFVGSRRPLNRLLAQIAELKRFVNAEEAKAVEALALLVQQKDALDFHRTLQLTLKAWLFVHIPLTYALLVLTGAHGVLIYGFSGGAR
jgi:hypothetical protein